MSCENDIFITIYTRYYLTYSVLQLLSIEIAMFFLINESFKSFLKIFPYIVTTTDYYPELLKIQYININIYIYIYI